jgi:hypothetical protein
VIGFVLVLVASFLYRMFVPGNLWRGTISGAWSASEWKDHTRLGRSVLLSDERHSDPARVRIVSGNQVESGSHALSGERPLPGAGVSDTSVRKNGDAAPRDDSDATSHPETERGRGSHE